MPEAERTALKDLRELIKSTVPEVQERPESLVKKILRARLKEAGASGPLPGF